MTARLRPVLAAALLGAATAVAGAYALLIAAADAIAEQEERS